MNWYLAKIIFRIICGNGNHRPQFDEQLRMISARDEAEALAKAKKIGSDEQESFFSEDRRIVQWKFIAVTELYDLSHTPDGAELFSRIEEYDHAEAYIELVHRKAFQLEQAQSQQILEWL